MSRRIVLPPPELRLIVDKTAKFVAEHGLEFEDKLLETEKGNPKFSFLLPADPYRPYYESKIQDYKSGVTAEPISKHPVSVGEIQSPSKPPILEFLTDAPPMRSPDLNLVKLTAQFVAKNGDHFLLLLSDREVSNPRFGFLNSHHVLYPLFIKLVGEYRLVLCPGNSLDRIKTYSRDRDIILEKILERSRWLAFDRTSRAQIGIQADQEGKLFESIDWQVFSIVGTLEFVKNGSDREFSQPISLQDLDVQDVVQLEPEPIQAEPKPHLPRALGIRRTMTQLCPRCKTQIPISEFDEHVRIELLDPKWMDQRQKYLERQTSNLESGEEINKRLRTLVQARTNPGGEIWPTIPLPNLDTNGLDSFSVRIQVPLEENRLAWKLNGQILNLDSLDSNTLVGTIKTKISELTFVPVSKQKLVVSGVGMLRNTQTLGEFGLRGEIVVQLNIKERGGSKK